MIYKKLSELQLITIDENDNIKIPDISKLEEYFKKKEKSDLK